MMYYNVVNFMCEGVVGFSVIMYSLFKTSIYYYVVVVVYSINYKFVSCCYNIKFI